MGYMKLVSESTFKSDSQGKTVFYPWWIVGKGYELPDRETEERIRKFVIWYHFTSLAVILLTGVFLGRWMVGFLVILPIALVVWIVQARRFTRGLAQTEGRRSRKK